MSEEPPEFKEHTYEDARLEQFRRFRDKPFSQKLEILEEMCEEAKRIEAIAQKEQ